MKSARPLLAVTLATTLFLSAFARADAQSQPVTIHIVETEQPVIIRLHSAKQSPGSFDSVSVRMSNTLQFSFATDNLMQPIPVKEQPGTFSGLQHTVPNFRPDPSRYFFQATYGPVGHQHTLLLFVGSSETSDANHAFLLAFKNDGTPYIALNLDNFEITSLLESDIGLKIIGKTSLSQVIAGSGFAGDKKPYATTYDPYSIFVMTSEKPAAYSIAESETFNRTEYVWAGQKTREDIAVLYNISGHARTFSVPASKVPKFIK